MPVAMILRHPSAQSEEELRRNILEVTVEQVIANLTVSHRSESIDNEPDTRELVFAGSFEEVNERFLKEEWSDGLPIVPPTRERVERFLAFSDRDPDEVLGVMLPDNRAATVWSVAVNGVMAGCRPEYMPILIALVEAMADPEYGVEHSGNTPGADTLIILNGPIIKRLRFNCTQGVMRDGFQPNTSIGRFWRLYLRNVVGFLPHKTDKATFGNTWRVVVAENEDALAHIGWEPLSVNMGYSAGDDTVTIARYTGGGMVSSMSGSTPEELLPYLADGVVKQTFWQVGFTVGQSYNRLRPLVLMSPIIAETIAKAGWSKQDLQRYLFDHARISARQFEVQQRDWRQMPIWNLTEEAANGNIPADLFAASSDPDRMIPLVWSPDHFMIVVTGDPLRTSCYAFGHNGYFGFPVARKIR
ncbi:MAG: hypothetical protein HY525_04430 [Betaproteobacteria bacterium]|nr:hypothetical protein [Betaproteobacteria bacterium]